MKRNNLLTEIQSNLKKLSDSQLADVADYIEMLTGASGADFEKEEEEGYDNEDVGFLNEEDDEDESFSRNDYDDNLY